MQKFGWNSVELPNCRKITELCPSAISRVVCLTQFDMEDHAPAREAAEEAGAIEFLCGLSAVSMNLKVLSGRLEPGTAQVIALQRIGHSVY